MQIKICLYLALAPRAYPKGQRNKPYMAVVLVTLQYEQILLMQLGRGTIYLHQDKIVQISETGQMRLKAIISVKCKYACTELILPSLMEYTTFPHLDSIAVQLKRIATLYIHQCLCL